ncbi:MAG: NAD-dependent epimerase/dehydratase family protein [Opitutaceae bacterium]
MAAAPTIPSLRARTLLSVTKKQLIVTGGAGFIGRNLIAALNERGEDSILVVDQLGSSDRWRNLPARSSGASRFPFTIPDLLAVRPLNLARDLPDCVALTRGTRDVPRWNRGDVRGRPGQSRSRKSCSTSLRALQASRPQ